MHQGLFTKKISSRSKTRGAGGGKKLSSRLLIGLALLLLFPLLITILARSGSGHGGSSSSRSNEGSKRSNAIQIYYNDSYSDYYDFLFPKEGTTKSDDVWFMFEPYSDYNAEISVKTSSGQEYTITLYDGRREIANTGTGEEINSKFEEDNKYFIKVTLEPNSYYNPNRSFTIKISPSIPMGADAEHAYTITEGRNGGSRPYESLYPADEYDSLAKQELLEDYGYSQEVWFSFTPEVSGNYTFNVEELDNNFDIFLYEEYRTYSSMAEAYDGSDLQYYLYSGNTYFYRVYLYHSYSGCDAHFAAVIDYEY